jgi:predicted RNA binding protein YcfA (HicA-like mRNA interferase family)
MRAREVNNRIEKLGGYEVRQRGSHRLYRNDSPYAQTTVPQHSGDIPKGTLSSIEKDMEPAFGKGWLK